MLKTTATLEDVELDAYHAAREGVAVMDRSTWGCVRMAGDDRVDFLHRMSTNEVRDLEPRMTRQTVLTSDIARIVAVVTTYAFPDHLLLMTDAGGAERAINHLQSYIFFRDDVKLADITQEMGMISLWGPRTVELLDGLTSSALSDLEPGTFIESEVGGVRAVVARTNELTVDGANLLVERDAAEPLLDRLAEAGAHRMGESLYEVLRVEAGRPRYGREMGEDYNPLEAGLKSVIDFEKGCYIGQEVVARLDTYDKVRQHLVTVGLDRLPAAGERPALTSGDRQVGFLTSWVESPAQGPIALGYVLSKHLESDLPVQVVDDEGAISGQVTRVWK